MALKARETCARCLWLWPELTDMNGPKRLCYCEHSVHYHQERLKECAGCATFEYGISSSGYAKGCDRKPK